MCSFAVLWSEVMSSALTYPKEARIYVNKSAGCDTVCPRWAVVEKSSQTIQHSSCEVTTSEGRHFLTGCASQRAGSSNKNWACNHSSHRLPQTLTHTSTQTQRESVYTSRYHPIIPDSQLRRPVRGPDNVALPPSRTMYPVPRSFGAIFLRVNKIVCTCSMLRQPFPNKSPALSTESESAVNQTHPQTSVTQTRREITATRSELLPPLIPNRKWAIYKTLEIVI